MNRALFLDRDGVINIDYGHVYKISDFKFYDDIFDTIRKFINQGYLIFVVSNQAGIAKGLYTINDLAILDQYMISEFAKQKITLTKTYYCPHKPEDNCDCRKPKPGMLLKAQKEYDIDLANSVLIGDKMSDLIAGYQAGIKNLYFKKGAYPEQEVKFNYHYYEEL